MTSPLRDAESATAGVVRQRVLELAHTKMGLDLAQWSDISNDFLRAADELDTARAEIERLREALEPFALAEPTNIYSGDIEDPDAEVTTLFTENQFRFARKAYDALQALDAELAEAKGASETLVGRLAEALVDRNAARFRATTAEAEAKAMREALEPFVVGEAAMEELLWGDLPDEATGTITAKLGDFRRARRALGGTDAK